MPATVIYTPNPFEPFRFERDGQPTGRSIWSWVQARFPEAKEFPTPTICLLNGKPLLRSGWNYALQDGDVVNFVAVAQGPVFVVLAVVGAAAAIAMAFLMPVPSVGSGPPESDPVYSTKGRFNTARLGEPIEVCYGRNRIYPSLAARPFFKYHNNDQFQHVLFCLGQGRYEIHEIRIGDTPIDNFEEVEYEVLGPGETPTLFPWAVYTATEVGGQELVAPNEDEYPSPDGWVGPFPACPANYTTNHVEVDVVFPKGIYWTNKKGGLEERSVSVEFQSRAIDNNGNPVGPWEAIIACTVSGATTTPQRRTFVHHFETARRCEVRARRTDDKIESTRAGHEVLWEGLRGFLTEDKPDFGEVTLLAIKVRATNNLNERTQQQFNIIATRKLPVWESGGWTEPQSTRSIVWAFCDLFRAAYGAGVEDTYLDLDALAELDMQWAADGRHFDWVFRDPITIWEAARVVARAGRAVPLVEGSRITLRPHVPQTLPTAMFSPENIVEGSFQWNVKLWSPTEYDALEVEYTEPETGYQPEQVLCILPGSSGNRPRSIRLQGIQDRVWAYREGMYELACTRYIRETVTFETGMEGFLPSYGDQILVSHHIPDWGQAGYVVKAEATPQGYHLYLSGNVEFEGESKNCQILLRKEDGSILGPLTAIPTTDPRQIEIHTSTSIDFLTGGEREPMLYLFGTVSTVAKPLRVVRVEPEGGERVQITAVNDASEVFAFDTASAPDLETTGPYTPTVPDVPTVSGLVVSQVDASDYIVQASWFAAVGASYYIVQTSTDGENFRTLGTTTQTAMQFQVDTPGDLTVRVAGVGNAQGPWASAKIAVGVLVTLDLAWTGLVALRIGWRQVLGAAGYRVQVLDNGPSEPELLREVDVDAAAFIYDYTNEEAAADAGSGVPTPRSLLFRVVPLFLNEELEPEPAEGFAEAEAENLLGEVSGMDYELVNQTPYDITYRLLWNLPPEEDLIRVRVWVSGDPDFNPKLTEPYLDEEATEPGWENLPTSCECVIGCDSNLQHEEIYWRVGVCDLWDEDDWWISDVQTIPASIRFPSGMVGGVLPTAIVGVPYYTLAESATCGAAPIRYLGAGEPPGLAVWSTAPVVSGTPTTTGFYSMAILAVDKKGVWAGRGYSIAVDPA